MRKFASGGESASDSDRGTKINLPRFGDSEISKDIGLIVRSRDNHMPHVDEMIGVVALTNRIGCQPPICEKEVSFVDDGDIVLAEVHDVFYDDHSQVSKRRSAFQPARSGIISESLEMFYNGQ